MAQSQLLSSLCWALFVLYPTLIRGGGNENLADLEAILDTFPDDHPMKLSYLEYPLANIGTQEEDWNAYHSGLAIHMENGREFTIDYRPRDPEHLMNFIRPLVHTKGQWPLWDVEIDWKNEAYIAWEESIDDRFTNMTYIGDANVEQLRHLVTWTKGFQAKYHSFQPISIVQDLNRTVITSTTCHDYVQGAVDVLFKHGASFSQEKSSMVFRDAVLIFSDKDPEIVDHQSLFGYLKILVYFRFFSYFVPAINRNFIHARAYLNEGVEQNVRFILHSNDVYYQLYLRYPYIDYCYTTLHLPRQGKEESELTSRFRHCKFTKANFPNKEEGAKKLAKPIAQAFSSTIGWARESLILLIPAALKINPQLAYVMIGLLGVMILLFVLRMLQMAFSFGKVCCGCSAGTFLSLVASAGLATAVLLSPLTKPLMDREPNNVRNWGLKGPGGGGGEEYAPIAFVGVFEMSKLNEYVLSVDTSYMLGSLDEESSEVYTGYLDLGTPALSVTMNAARKDEEWGTGLRRFFDGLTLFRIAQILRIGIHVKGNREMQRLELYLSILGSGYLMGAEKSGEFWKRVLGIGIGEAVIRDDDGKNKISVSAKCEKGESSLLCSASGDETIAGSLDLIPLMTKQHGVNHPNVDKFDKAHADVLSVGLTVVN